jgi:hypothetical protein
LQICSSLTDLFTRFINITTQEECIKYLYTPYFIVGVINGLIEVESEGCEDFQKCHRIFQMLYRSVMLLGGDISSKKDACNSF